MALTWKLQFDGQTLPLAQWGIESAVLTTYNLDADELAFAVPVSSIIETPDFADGDFIALWLYQDGEAPACKFRGRIREIPGDDSAGGPHRQQYVAKSAWNALERIIYKQVSVFWNETFTALRAKWSTRVILGQDNWGHRITTNDQIAYIALYSLQQAANIYVLADLPTLTETWFQEARDISCADAIKRMIGMTPDCVGYMNYTTNPPILTIQRRADLDDVILDLADKDLILELKPRPRYDLVIRGVVFNFVTQHLNEADGRYYVRNTEQTAGFTTGEAVVSTTIELSGQGGPQAETPPIGVAAAYLASRNVLHWEFSMRMKRRDTPLPVRVGNVINLANGRAEWASMAAVVQSVSEDLVTGTAQVKVGPPEHLGPQDFLSLMSNFRRQPPTTNFAETRHNGDEGTDGDEDHPGTDPENPEGPGANPEVPDGEGNDNAGRPAEAGGGSATGGVERIEHCVDGIQVTSVVKKG